MMNRPTQVGCSMDVTKAGDKSQGRQAEWDKPEAQMRARRAERTQEERLVIMDEDSDGVQRPTITL